MRRAKPGRSPPEFYLWGGMQLRYHLYNALLEGQFRDSTVTFDRHADLESLLWEASLGITRTWSSGLGLTVLLRARRPEVPDAAGLDPVWGGVIISSSL